MVDAMRSSVSGCELAGCSGPRRRDGGDAGSIGGGPAAGSGRPLEAGSAGVRWAGAAQTRQIAQPSARDRGISHLSRETQRAEREQAAGSLEARHLPAEPAAELAELAARRPRGL